MTPSGRRVMRSASCGTSHGASFPPCSQTAGWWRRSSRSPTDTAAAHRTLAPAVESTAYFVVAEALTNTAKHADARRSWIRLTHERRALMVLVGDDGRGGAD